MTDLRSLNIPAIYGVGLNYTAHAAEVSRPEPEFPMIFMKPPSSVTLEEDAPIILPRALRSDKVDYEGELCVVIGERCKNVPEEEALSVIGSYTLAMDISARDWQFEWGGSQFCRGKSFDGFCPVGPVLLPGSEISDPQALTISTRLNGETMQHSRTEMLFSVARIISFLSGSTTLEPGTLILTGTPSGVGQQQTPPRFLKAGDLLEVEIPEIGTLTRRVVEEVL